MSLINKLKVKALKVDQRSENLGMKLWDERTSKFRISMFEHLDLVEKTVEMLPSGSQVEKSHA